MCIFHFRQFFFYRRYFCRFYFRFFCFLSSLSYTFYKVLFVLRGDVMFCMVFQHNSQISHQRLAAYPVATDAVNSFYVVKRNDLVFGKTSLVNDQCPFFSNGIGCVNNPFNDNDDDKKDDGNQHAAPLARETFRVPHEINGY